MGHHQKHLCTHCGRSQEERRKKGIKRTRRKKISSNLPNLIKDKNVNMQGTQQISGGMNSKRPTPKGVKIRHLKDNKDLVSSRRDASYSHTGDPVMLPAAIQNSNQLKDSSD